MRIKQIWTVALAGAVALSAVRAEACWWEDVMVTFDGDCNVTKVTYKGEEPEPNRLKIIMARVNEDLKDMKKENGSCLGGGKITGSGGGGSGTGATEDLRQAVINTMLVKPETEVDSTSGKKAYEDNINSVRENRNKIKMNAITRSIALGRRAVALAQESGKDIDERRAAIEQNDDVMSMLKEIAKLEAQHLQKVNEITALRARMIELNSIENILTGSVVTTDEDALKKAGKV